MDKHRLSLKAALVAILAVSLEFIGGPIEGHFFPVNSPATITRMEPAPNGSTRIWGNFDLHRPNCDFAGLAWDLVGGNRRVAAAITFEGGTKDRDGGAQEFGPWLVQLTVEQLGGSSSATAYHSCPFRWWLTETRFFP